MYERFTDRARKVMQLANQEALRLNHPYLGTEHVLLGLVKEGHGVAAHVLKNLNVELKAIRLAIEGISLPSKPDSEVLMGRLLHTPRVKQVIAFSIEEARDLNHTYVGTEHLLLGLLREHEGVADGPLARQILINLGLKLETVREETLSLLGKKQNAQKQATPTPTGTLPQPDVFAILSAERTYQDSKWGTLQEHPHEVGGWLTILRVLVTEAEYAWASSKGNLAAVTEVWKIAAVAAACLEQHGKESVLQTIRDMEWIKDSGGYVTPNERLKKWIPVVDLIRRRMEQDAEADAAKKKANLKATTEALKDL